MPQLHKLLLILIDKPIPYGGLIGVAVCVCLLQKEKKAKKREVDRSECRLEVKRKIK